MDFEFTFRILMMIEIVNQPQNTTRYSESRLKFPFFFYRNSVVYSGSQVIMNLLFCIYYFCKTIIHQIQVISQGLWIFINEYFQLKMNEYLISLWVWYDKSLRHVIDNIIHLLININFCFDIVHVFKSMFRL